MSIIMSNAALRKLLRFNETTVVAVHPSWWRYRWSFAFALGIVVVDFFFLTPLQKFGGKGTTIFIAVLLFAFLWVLRSALLRSLNVLLVTSRRFVDVHHRRLFDREVSECPLEDIHQVRYHKKGLIAMIGNIGTMIVDTGANKGHFAIADIHNPDHLKELIVRAQKQYTKFQTTEQVDDDDSAAFSDEDDATFWEEEKRL